MDPGNFKEQENRHERHLITRRFFESSHQQEIVNDIIDIVMMNLSLSRSVIAGLEWSINEITDNVLNHSQSLDGGLVQVSTFMATNTVSFAVADSGIGILRSLRNSLPLLNNDVDAIGEAVKAGVTRDSNLGQGNGLAGTLRIATMTGGSFSVTSGRGHVAHYEGEAKRYVRDRLEFYKGTLICTDIKIGAENFSLEEALGFDGRTDHVAVDHIELNYLNETGELINFCVRDQTTGVGNRHAGRQLRTMIGNLLKAEPNKPIIINWEGIPLISSSFADEFMGKLFLEMGAMFFISRIRNVNMESLIAKILDKAVAQRLTQAADSEDSS